MEHMELRAETLLTTCNLTACQPHDDLCVVYSFHRGRLYRWSQFHHCLYVACKTTLCLRVWCNGSTRSAAVCWCLV